MKTDSLRLIQACQSDVLRVILFFLFFFFPPRQSWPLLTVNTLYLTPVKLQLPLFPGRTNNHPLKYNPKDSLSICTGGKKHFCFCFLCGFCWGLFLLSLLVTLFSSQFSIELSPPLLSICERIWWLSAWPWDGTPNGWPWKCVVSFREAPARGLMSSASLPTPPGAAMWRMAESLPASTLLR